ncbi:PREDICTED: uncharacterized protein LOC109216874 [Nicotiana attenuata]|uniref:uncharacterized protein LOC109216874 n=1 Tax=Nicotiana attenuata TaxID=49451 RepID=UPI0009059D06|nr:PREDICTED: uncharacterized protein LOC109216874 [Nicotiana attenuata]
MQASWIVQKILKAAEYMEEAGIQEEEIKKMAKFNMHMIYRKLQGEFQKCTWKRLICNNYAIPRWKFILFLALHDRLQTRDRVAKWSLVEDSSCTMCEEDPETIEHLFFGCTMTEQIWSNILKWQGIKRRAKGWAEEVRWAEMNVKGKSAKSHMYRICLAACVYHIWHKRNMRVFQQKIRSKEEVLRAIAQEIHYCGSKYRKLDKTLQEMKSYPRFE